MSELLTIGIWGRRCDRLRWCAAGGHGEKHAATGECTLIVEPADGVLQHLDMGIAPEHDFVRLLRTDWAGCRFRSAADVGLPVMAALQFALLGLPRFIGGDDGASFGIEALR